MFAEKHMKIFFWRSHQKGLHDLSGRKFAGKSRTKNFRARLGKFGQKSFAPPKIYLLLDLCWTPSGRDPKILGQSTSSRELSGLNYGCAVLVVYSDNVYCQVKHII